MPFIFQVFNNEQTVLVGKKLFHIICFTILVKFNIYFGLWLRCRFHIPRSLSSPLSFLDLL